MVREVQSVIERVGTIVVEMEFILRSSRAPREAGDVAPGFSGVRKCMERMAHAPPSRMDSTLTVCKSAIFSTSALGFTYSEPWHLTESRDFDWLLFGIDKYWIS